MDMLGEKLRFIKTDQTKKTILFVCFLIPITLMRELNCDSDPNIMFAQMASLAIGATLAVWL